MSNISYKLKNSDGIRNLDFKTRYDDFSNVIHASDPFFVSTKIYSPDYNDCNDIYHLHYEWIKIYKDLSSSSTNTIAIALAELTKINLTKELSVFLSEVILKEIEYYESRKNTYYEAANISIDSLMNTLKFIPFLICYQPNFYIDATTGFLGCTIKKKKANKKHKNLNLVFQANDDVVFSLTERKNGIVTISGIADFDDDLEDTKALVYLLEL